MISAVSTHSKTQGEKTMILSDVKEILPEDSLKSFIFLYVCGVLVVSFLLRVILCSLRSVQDYYEKPSSKNDSGKIICKTIKQIWKIFCPRFKGVSKSHPDFWFPTILGTGELFVYPVLMLLDAWNFVGAWLIFKTIPNWGLWKDDRSTYNRFLIGNALTLILSFIIAVIVFSL